MSPVAIGALLLSFGGVIVGVLAAAAARRIRAGVAPMLELWTAAGLVRLSADTTWTTIATAAIIVFVRQLVVRALGRSERLRYR